MSGPPVILSPGCSSVSFPAIDNFGKSVVKRSGYSPFRIMIFHFGEIAVIADVIADPRLIRVFPDHFAPRQRSDFVECFKNRDAVLEAAADVVNLGNAGSRKKLTYKFGHIKGMDVVPHLL